MCTVIVCVAMCGGGGGGGGSIHSSVMGPGGGGGGELTRDVGTSDVNIFTAITHYMTGEITAAGLSRNSGQTLAAE